jgi:hypothetical protein
MVVGTCGKDEKETVRMTTRRRDKRSRSSPHASTVKRRMTLDLGLLGKEALEEQAGVHNLSVPVLLRGAALYYLGERDSGRLAWRVPPFARSGPRGRHDGQLEVALELNEDVWRLLEAESDRQQVALSQLLEHAALFFLSDLDSSSRGARALECLEDGS